MKKIFTFLMLMVFISGCVTTSQFARIGGTKNADLHGIRVYRGEPPEDINYESLGMIEAKGSGALTLIQLDNGLENLTLKAKELGANGVIKWKTRSGMFSVMMEGEAVIFAKENYIREDVIVKKAPEKYLEGGVINKEEAILIAKNELLQGKYKECFNYSNLTVGYDDSDDEHHVWFVQFKPKEGYEHLYCYGVMVNKDTGEMHIGDFEGL